MATKTAVKAPVLVPPAKPPVVKPPAIPNLVFGEYTITQEPAEFYNCKVGQTYNVAVHLQHRLPTQSADPTNLNIANVLIKAIAQFGFFPPVTVNPLAGIRTAVDGVAHLSVTVNAIFDYPLYLKVGEGPGASTSAVRFIFAK